MSRHFAVCQFAGKHHWFLQFDAVFSRVQNVPEVQINGLCNNCTEQLLSIFFLLEPANRSLGDHILFLFRKKQSDTPNFWQVLSGGIPDPEMVSASPGDTVCGGGWCVHTSVISQGHGHGLFWRVSAETV